MYVAIIVASARQAVHRVCGSKTPRTGTQNASISIAIQASSRSVEYRNCAKAERATIDQIGLSPCIVRRLSAECVRPSQILPPLRLTALAKAQSSIMASLNVLNPLMCSNRDVSTNTHPPAAAAMSRLDEFDRRNG